MRLEDRLGKKKGDQGRKEVRTRGSNLIGDSWWITHHPQPTLRSPSVVCVAGGVNSQGSCLSFSSLGPQPLFQTCVDKALGEKDIVDAGVFCFGGGGFEVWLINNVVLISAIQQSDSVIHTHVLFLCILFHYGLSPDIECSSLYYVGY